MKIKLDITLPCCLLGVAFVVLKLCHVIDWSWVWVTCPFWGFIALTLGLIAIGWIIAGGIMLFLGGILALLKISGPRSFTNSFRAPLTDNDRAQMEAYERIQKARKTLRTL